MLRNQLWAIVASSAPQPGEERIVVGRGRRSQNRSSLFWVLNPGSIQNQIPQQEEKVQLGRNLFFHSLGLLSSQAAPTKRWSAMWVSTFPLLRELWLGWATQRKLLWSMRIFSFVIISFIFAFYLFCGNFHQFFFESCFLVSPTGNVSWEIFKFDTVLKKYTRNNETQNHLYHFAILHTCTWCWWHPQQSLSQPGRYQFPPLASPLWPKRRSLVSLGHWLRALR